MYAPNICYLQLTFASPLSGTAKFADTDVDGGALFRNNLVTSVRITFQLSTSDKHKCNILCKAARLLWKLVIIGDLYWTRNSDFFFKMFKMFSTLLTSMNLRPKDVKRPTK